MAQFYSDESRENDLYSLPDAEVFYITKMELSCGHWGDHEIEEPGWYYWFCFPGCLPDSDPIGPFETEAEAIDACRDEYV